MRDKRVASGYTVVMTSTLGFFTHNELDPVVGHRRRRQRLVKGGVLPRGENVSTFGRQTIIFPEFVAAGLVVSRPTEQDEHLLALLRSEAEQLYETESFGEIAEVIRSVLREHADWRLTDLVTALVEQASDALGAWREQVGAAEHDLAEAGIVLHIQLGRIEKAAQTGYRVALADSGEVISVGANAARTELAPGMWVTRDVVELGARKGEVLVPTVSPDVLSGLSENPVALAERGQDSDEMFANIDFQPIVVPILRQTDDDDWSNPRGDLVRPVRRVKVRANRAIYANAAANTMARADHQPLAVP
jgi:hypothetical protein